MTGLTSPLIYFSNSTGYILSGNQVSTNITLASNQGVYVFDNANLTDGITIANFPLGINTQGDTKHLTSTLINSISLPVISDIGDCDTKNYISYTTDSGVKTEWKGTQAHTICNQLKTTGLTLSIEPSTSSNILTWTDGTTNLASTILKILIGFIALAILVIGILGISMHLKDNVNELSSNDWIKYGVAFLIILILGVALMGYISEII